MRERNIVAETLLFDHCVCAPAKRERLCGNRGCRKMSKNEPNKNVKRMKDLYSMRHSRWQRERERCDTVATNTIVQMHFTMCRNLNTILLLLLLWSFGHETRGDARVWQIPCINPIDHFCIVTDQWAIEWSSRPIFARTAAAIVWAHVAAKEAIQISINRTAQIIHYFIDAAHEKKNWYFYLISHSRIDNPISAIHDHDSWTLWASFWFNICCWMRSLVSTETRSQDNGSVPFIVGRARI